MHDLLADVVRAIRSLRRAPAFTATALVVMALGIGGSAVVFSVVNALLLQPLPYREPERLVLATGHPDWKTYEQWRDGSKALDGIAASHERAANVAGAGEPERVTIARVTPGFFAVIGVRPVIGRGFSTEHFTSGHGQVVLLTDAFWRRHYGGSPSAIGRSLALDDRSYTVIGVLPGSFRTVAQLLPARGLSFDRGAALVIPLAGDPLARDPLDTDQWSRGLAVIGRLRRDVTLAAAESEASAIARRAAARSSSRSEGRPLTPLAEYVRGDLPSQMLLVGAAVAVMLLVACANVANLLLARATARRHEMATRTALGASTAQLVRHVLIETLVLAVAGGAAGVVFALGGARIVAGYGSVLARLGEVTIDPRAIVFSAVLSVAIGVVVSIVPAFRIAGFAPAPILRGGPSTTPAGSGMSSSVVVFEIVVSLALGVCATLLVRNLVRVAGFDLGFREAGVITADVSLSRAQYPAPPTAAAFFAELLSRAERLPGVESAALASLAPAANALMSANARVEGGAHAPAPSVWSREDQTTEFCQAIGGDYFRTLSIPVLRGRPLTSGDSAGRAPVVVVNEAFARKYWNTPGDALGRAVVWGDVRFAIVGIVGDVRWVGALHQPPLPLIYFPYEQFAAITRAREAQMTLIVKGRAGAGALAAPLTRLMRQINPNQPLYNVLTLDRIVSAQLARPRLVMTMMGMFAAMALVLASAGLYGVMSYAVARRSREIGVRLAIGASRRDVFRLVVGRGAKLVAIGVGFGLPLAFALARFIASQLVGVTRTDPASYGFAAALAVALGLAGCAIPAWRAMRVDPVITLRE